MVNFSIWISTCFCNVYYKSIFSLHWIVNALLKTEHICGAYFCAPYSTDVLRKGLNAWAQGVWLSDTLQVSALQGQFFRVAPNPDCTTTLVNDPAVFLHFGLPSEANFLHCRDFVLSTLQNDRFPCPNFPPYSCHRYYTPSKALHSQLFLSICFLESLTWQIIYMSIPHDLDYCCL